jgi:uroporphyrinogen III methyltransferase/synthase
MKDREHMKTEAQTGEEKSLLTLAKPLRRKTVLLTRPREQAEEMTALLEESGAEVIHLPMIEIREPESWQALDESINQLHLYDWLLFTSANGVKFFFQRFRQLCGTPLSPLANLQVCAIGKATAQAVEAAGAKVDLIAEDSKAEGLLQSLVAHFGAAEAICKFRFLLPRARLAREVLPEELRKLGAQVDAVEAYQNVLPATDSENLIGLLRAGSIDVITFTSPSTVKNFVALVGREKLAELLGNALIACIGPVTAATATEFNLQNIIQPDNYSAPALVETIVQAVSKK